MSSPPRRVLVTGASGLLGRAVTQRLATASAVELVVAVDRVRLPAFAGPVAALEHDVRESLAEVIAANEIDTVIHHAFMVRPPRDETVAAVVNVDAAAALAQTCAEAGVRRLIYPSSTTVYGAWPNAPAHTEDEDPRPMPGFAYSQHKVAAERAVLAAAGRGVTAVVLRACVVLAAGADNFIASSLGLPIFPLPRGANPPMQFLLLSDYVGAVEAALKAPRTAVYNVAGAGTVTVREMVKIAGGRTVAIPAPVLRTVVEASWRLRLQSRAPAAGIAFIQHPWLAATDRIRAELGWEPTATSRQAVEEWADARPAFSAVRRVPSPRF